MHTTLLTTKLHVPPPCPNLVARPRLATDLSKVLMRRFTLVSGTVMAKRLWSAVAARADFLGRLSLDRVI
jgi:hypothetical protein